MVRYKIVNLRLSEALGKEYALDPRTNFAVDTPFGVKFYVEDFPPDTKLFVEVNDKTALGYIYTGKGKVRGRIVIPPVGPPFVVQYAFGKATARFPKVHNKRLLIPK